MQQERAGGLGGDGAPMAAPRARRLQSHAQTVLPKGTQGQRTDSEISVVPQKASCKINCRLPGMLLNGLA